MKTIRKISPSELEEIKSNAFKNPNREVLFSYLDADCQRYSFNSNRWVKINKHGGPRTSNDYISFLCEGNGYYYISQHDNASDSKRYKFTKEEATNLGFI